MHTLSALFSGAIINYKFKQLTLYPGTRGTLVLSGFTQGLFYPGTRGTWVPGYFRDLRKSTRGTRVFSGFTQGLFPSTSTSSRSGYPGTLVRPFWIYPRPILNHFGVPGYPVPGYPCTRGYKGFLHSHQLQIKCNNYQAVVPGTRS